MMLSVVYEHSEPYFQQPLPVVCPRKPNFTGPWELRSVPNDDVPGEHFEYFIRRTSDGLMYIADL